MQLNIENFTSDGNQLLYRDGWNKFQKEKCMSKSRITKQNKLHYDRILYSLTDTKSINVLNKESTKALTKMTENEYIAMYVREWSGKKSPDEMASAIHLSYPESEYEESESGSSSSSSRSLYSESENGGDYMYHPAAYERETRTKKSSSSSDSGSSGAGRSSNENLTQHFLNRHKQILSKVLEQIKMQQNLAQVLDSGMPRVPTDIMINVDGEPVRIRSNDIGVTATDGPDTLDLPVVRYRDLNDDATVRFVDPAQNTVPRDLPPMLRPVRFNPFGLPNTNGLNINRIPTTTNPLQIESRPTPEYRPRSMMALPSSVTVYNPMALTAPTRQTMSMAR